VALRVLADRLEHGEAIPAVTALFEGEWPATKARLVLAALLRIGWTVKRATGSHRSPASRGAPA
jgi:hypothetical protein